MRPMKPKKLSRRLEAALNERAARETTTQHLTPEEAVREIHSRSEARAILAALEYERQRADKAEKIIIAMPPEVAEMVQEHPGHIFNWKVRCITCAPTRAEARRYGLNRRD